MRCSRESCQGAACSHDRADNGLVWWACPVCSMRVSLVIRPDCEEEAMAVAHASGWSIPALSLSQAIHYGPA